MESSEKLAAPSKSRHRYEPMPSTLGSPHPQAQAAREHLEVVTSAADRLYQHHRSDDKYWAQIRYAQQLLCRSIGTELAINEASRQQVLEPLFRDALDAQEADRMSAITMMSVLNELVTRMDGEMLQRRASSPAPVTPKNAGKRARQGSPMSEDRDSADELMGDTEAIAQMSLASPAPGRTSHAVDSPPMTPPRTPQRPQRRFRGAFSASPSRDFSLVPCTPDRAPRPGFVAQTPEPIRRRPALLASPEPSGKDEDLASKSRKKLRLPPFPAAGTALRDVANVVS